MELADQKIRVNAISAALVVTTIYGEFIEPEKIDETLCGFNGAIPWWFLSSRPKKSAQTCP
jgi:hypothetical protein